MTATTAPGSFEERVPLLLWPAGAPGSTHLALTETITERSKDPSRQDRIVTGITQPTLTMFAPARPNGAALVIASGGAYQRQVLDKEGSEVAQLLAPEGVTVFLLRYRLPAEGHQQPSDVPLQDAQRAVRLVRSRAKQFGVDPGRIGILGFSAGGHLAASLAVGFAERVYAPRDAIDAASARPDYVILLYPVISMLGPLAHAESKQRLLGEHPSQALATARSPERHVTLSTPPTLLILTDDDTAVSPLNSIAFYDSLHRAGISVEMHVYPRGGHGFGIRGAQGQSVAEWPRVMARWLAALGVTK